MNKWILCSERQPTKEETEENEGMFLVTAVNQKAFTDTDEFNWRWGKWQYNRKVIAWQPLPKPYKEEPNVK